MEFLDKRWTSAELDPYRARRSVLLLSFVAIGCATVIFSLAAAAAGLVALVLVAQGFLGFGSCSPATALLVTIGACVLAMTVRRRGTGGR